MLPLLVAIGILAATSWPRPPAMPNDNDKVVHFVSYAMLGASLAWAARLRTIGTAVLWFGAASLFGAVDEWHQQFIPNRRADVRDWLADTAGAAAGVSLVTARLRRREFPA